MLQVAATFTIACVILSGNAVLSFWPNIMPGFTPPPVVLYIEGVLSVMSSTLFLIGGVFSFIEVLKARRGERLQNESVVWRNYGTVVVEEDVADEDEKVEEKTRRESIRIAVTEVLEKTTSLARTISLTAHEAAIDEDDKTTTKNTNQEEEQLTWQTLLTLHELRTFYLSQLQFVASLISLTSSFIYTITAILALISIFRTSTIATWIRFPQLVAAFGFALSSWLAMVQAQRSWWRPALKRVVWHANLLNLIGSLGFIFCSILGLLQHSWAEYQFGCTFLWGSWAFLIASAMSSWSAFRKGKKRVGDSKV